MPITLDYGQSLNPQIGSAAALGGFGQFQQNLGAQYQRDRLQRQQLMAQMLRQAQSQQAQARSQQASMANQRYLAGQQNQQRGFDRLADYNRRVQQDRQFQQTRRDRIQDAQRDREFRREYQQSDQQFRTSPEYRDSQLELYQGQSDIRSFADERAAFRKSIQPVINRLDGPSRQRVQGMIDEIPHIDGMKTLTPQMRRSRIRKQFAKIQQAAAEGTQEATLEERIKQKVSWQPDPVNPERKLPMILDDKGVPRVLPGYSEPKKESSGPDTQHADAVKKYTAGHRTWKDYRSDHAAEVARLRTEHAERQKVLKAEANDRRDTSFVEAPFDIDAAVAKATALLGPEPPRPSAPVHPVQGSLPGALGGSMGMAMGAPGQPVAQQKPEQQPFPEGWNWGKRAEQQQGAPDSSAQTAGNVAEIAPEAIGQNIAKSMTGLTPPQQKHVASLVGRIVRAAKRAGETVSVPELQQEVAQDLKARPVREKHRRNRVIQRQGNVANIAYPERVAPLGVSDAEWAKTPRAKLPPAGTAEHYAELFKRQPSDEFVAIDYMTPKGYGNPLTEKQVLAMFAEKADYSDPIEHAPEKYELNPQDNVVVRQAIAGLNGIEEQYNGQVLPEDVQKQHRHLLLTMMLGYSKTPNTENDIRYIPPGIAFLHPKTGQWMKKKGE